MLYVNDFKGCGFVTSPPRVVVSQSSVRANFTLALNRPGRSSAFYIDCIAWDIQATKVKDLVSKGTQLYVSGEIETQSFKDSVGSWHRGFHVKVEKLEIVSNPRVKGPEPAALRLPKSPITKQDREDRD